MRTAFTYGKKLRYKDLDDPHYRSSINLERREKAIKSKRDKDLDVIKENVLLDKTPRRLRLRGVDESNTASIVKIQEVNEAEIEMS